MALRTSPDSDIIVTIGMICPACHCPYRPGFRLCADCRVSLVARLSSNSAGVVRDEVRQIACELGTVRWKTAFAWTIPSALLLPFLIAPDDGPSATARRMWAGLFFGALVVLAGVSALPMASGRGSLRYEELKNDLAELPVEVAAAFLLPLRAEAGDVPRTARALMRDLRIPTEIAPADSADGRGDEAAAI